MVRFEKGNILNARESFICQQVNCQGKMGKGLGLQIAKAWPSVKEEYVKQCNLYGRSLLGTNLYTEIEKSRTIVNMFGQVYYGTDDRYTDYDALSKCFQRLKNHVMTKDKTMRRIAIPSRIGCGLAGGDWNLILNEICQVFNDTDIDCVIYEFER